MSCQQPVAKPELAAIQAAVSYWETGVKHLEAGESEKARLAFAEALKWQPEDVVLRVWWAKSLAAGGHLDAAVRALDHVLSEQPTFSEARYNKAAYLARLGRIEEAAPELQSAIRAGAASSYDVHDDPDFQDWLDHPALGFLPEESITVHVEGPGGSVFMGSEFGVRVKVLGASQQIQMRPIDVGGPFEFLGVVEEVRDSEVGALHEFDIRFRAVGPGELKISSFQIQSGKRSSRVDGVKVVALAPPNTAISPVALSEKWIRTPAELRESRPVPSVWREGEALMVLSKSADDVKADRDLGVPIVYLVKEKGQPTWKLRVWLGSSSPVQVRILRRGRIVFQEALVKAP